MPAAASAPAPRELACPPLPTSPPAGSSSTCLRRKVIRPKREPSTEGDGEGRQRSFDIVKAKPDPPQRSECKDEDDGGQPPYGVCDWTFPLPDSARPIVRVVRAPPESLRYVTPVFRNEDGRWMRPSARTSDQPGEPFDSTWRDEAIARPYWWHQSIKNYTPIYAGTGDTAVTLVSFAPDLFVQLHDLPVNKSPRTMLCPSLSLGARAQDLP